MKTTLSLALLATVALTACGGETFTDAELEALLNNDAAYDEASVYDDLTNNPYDDDTFPYITYATVLNDVNGGSDYYGYGTADYNDGTTLIVSYSALPDLEEGYFYEGWVVDGVSGDVLSTGALALDEDEDWENYFYYDASLESYPQYIITLEPDDGDPAPADHVLEGRFEEDVS
jgi:hypothetical protein